MKTSNIRVRGFTLIELLVVVAIIAILTAVILTSLNSSKAKARDGRRISDVSQIQLALEQYFDRCQSYPQWLTTGGIACSTGNYLGDYISVIPTDPTTGQGYDYCPVQSGSNYTDYVIHTRLEQNR